ncbi:MAG: Uma2 family endonuclease [Clostridiales bacterium]|jgi:Uma2 family endonuclease|nr:Uma2 family endonuclease [Clostridiales bacterium]
MPLLYHGRYDYQDKEFTLEEFIHFNELPDYKVTRFEFIDGFVYAMASPSPNHSRVIQFIMSKLYPYFIGKT